MRGITFWIGPLVTSLFALAVYGPLGVSRDFGAFIIGLFVLLPILSLAVLASGIWLLLDRRPRWSLTARSVLLAALAPALLIPGLWGFSDPLRDPARYAIWSTLHRGALDTARRKDGVFLYWDSWGMAGENNDSYLASDPTDTLSRPGAAAPWAAKHRLSCPLARVQRMDKGVFVLTTSNCTLTL